MVHALDQQQQDAVASRLGELIKQVGLSSDPQSRMVREHLETAAALVQGAMPDETILNLELARRAGRNLEDHGLRDTVSREVSDVIESMARQAHGDYHPHGRPHSDEPPAKDLNAFFHGSDTTFGVFYPTKFIIAVFVSLESARLAYQALREAGFRDHDAIAVPGSEVVNEFQRIKQRSGVSGTLMKEFSRLIDTEASFVDTYQQWAQHGAGFVAIYSPEEEDANRAAEIIGRFDPLAAHWYTSSFVRTLQV